jgi:hypothetical protein
VGSAVGVLPNEALGFAIFDEEVAREHFAVADEFGETSSRAEGQIELKTEGEKERKAHLILACLTRFSIGGIAVRTLSLVADLNGVRIARCFASRRSTCNASLARLISRSSSLILVCSSRRRASATCK